MYSVKSVLVRATPSADILRKHPGRPGLMICLAISIVIGLSACLDESFTSDPADQPAFSTDTLSFDTVLTSISTVTRLFKIYNPHNRFLRIDEVGVTGPYAGFFRLNVDGRSGQTLQQVEIPPDDSIYVFVEATIDPDQPLSVSPFVIDARVTCRTQGVNTEVVLIAFGQNANYLPGPDQPNRISLLTCELGEEVWDDPRPYVIYGTLLIDSCTLVLPPGTRLYVHGGIANNAIGIYQDGLIYTFPNGRLDVQGTREQPVVIRDDRIEPDHEGIWGGLRLGPGSGPHRFRYADISQSLVGIYADSAVTAAIDYCRIYNTDGPGLFARQARVNVTNTLFYNNDAQAVALTYGGDYSLEYCTVANFGNNREGLLINNFYCTDALCSEGARLYPMTAAVRNSIIVGSSRDEIWISDAMREDPSMMQLTLSHNILITDELLDADNYPDFYETLCGQCTTWSFADPLFVSLGMEDYHLDSLSIARQRGVPLAGIPDDLDGNPRDPVTPDLGCYERID